MSRIIELFPDWASEGVFKRLGTLHGDIYPWATEHGETLDIEYMYSRSGNKISSILLDRFKVGGVITDDNLTKIVNIIHVKCLNRWSRLWDISKAEYNPIENYSMTETETPNITKETTVNIDSEVIQTGNNNGSVYAFNSVQPSPQTKADTNTTTTSKANKNNNITTETHKGTRNLTRSGNIGVTTSQQMIESEIELWKWSFFETVFEDVDRILTINMYGGE